MDKTKIARLLSRLKIYFRDPGTMYYYSCRTVRNTHIRAMLHRVVIGLLPKADAAIPPAEDIADLKKDGILVWDQLADSSTVNTICQYLASKPVYDLQKYDAGEGQEALNLSDVVITKQRKLKYFESDIAQCKEIIELANSPQIMSLVSAYLGCKPTVCMMSAWWTKAGPEAGGLSYDDMFHRDVPDYKFIKLFVYLNDVEEKNGAHCFIRGSHLSNQCTQRRMLSTEEIDRHFSKENQIVITGKSGCGFLEDTWGLHRSLPCEEGERLVLHYLFSLTPFNDQYPPKPLAKNIYNVDQYSNRVYLY